MTRQADLKNQLLSFFEEACSDNENVFLIDFIKNPKNNSYQFLIDGDEPVKLSDIAGISKGISNRVDEELEEDLAFTFQVSTPGADKPLVNQRQYKKHIGRTIRVENMDGEEFEGELLRVSVEEIQIEIPANKKKKIEAEKKTVPFNIIKKSTIKLAF